MTKYGNVLRNGDVRLYFIVETKFAKEWSELYLKECEFRFNLRGGGAVYHEMLKLFRKNPLFSESNNNA